MEAAGSQSETTQPLSRAWAATAETKMRGTVLGGAGCDYVWRKYRSTETCACPLTQDKILTAIDSNEYCNRSKTK